MLAVGSGIRSGAVEDLGGAESVERDECTEAVGEEDCCVWAADEDEPSLHVAQRLLLLL